MGELYVINYMSLKIFFLKKKKQDVHILISRISEYVALYGKKGFARLN